LPAGFQLPDDFFDFGNFLIRATDHDAVIFAFSDQSGGTAGRFGLAANLFRVELLHQRQKVRRGSAEQFHALELARGGRRLGRIKLQDELFHAAELLALSQHDDLFAARVSQQLGRQQRIDWSFGRLVQQLRDHGDDFSRQLGPQRNDFHLAFSLFRADVEDIDNLLDLGQLLVGRRDQEPVVDGDRR
jgi:hypothetical protein